MRNFFKLACPTLIALSITSTPAFAGALPVGVEMPFGGGLGLMGLAAAGIIGGIWIARRRR